MPLNTFKTLYHAVTEEDATTDNSLEAFNHERMIFVPGNIGLIKNTDGEVIRQSWWNNGSLYPLPERDLDELKEFVDQELVKNPDAKWGLLNLEAPHLKLINGDGTEQNRKRAIDSIKTIYDMLKAEYPQIKWTNYNMPYRNFWAMVNPDKNYVMGYISEKCEKFADVIEYMDWLAPSCYDAYNSDAFTTENEKQFYKNSQIKYCESGNLLMKYYKQYTSTSKPVIAVLHHGYISNGRYSHVSIEPDSSVTQTPYPVYNQATHGESGEKGMYLWKPIKSEEWMEECGEVCANAGYQGIYMWHWNKGFFGWCFSSLTGPVDGSQNALDTYNQVLYHRAKIRWWMSLSNDFGFTPYTAPSPTSHSSWTSGASSIEVRGKMRSFFKLAMKKKMDDIRNYALEIKPAFFKPPIHTELNINTNLLDNTIDDFTLTPLIDDSSLPS